jgi:molybdate transport system substrate-binding protein
LVIITPKGKSFKVTLDPSFKFSNAFNGKLCTGETASVPVGIYAKQALTHFKWWSDIQPRIVGTQDVRAALTLVERGECDVGIVYKTDASISEKVEVVAVFPTDSHEPITYPLSLIQGSNQEARLFYNYLLSAPASAIFKRFGFELLQP